MIIYHYSCETGRYIHASVVEIDCFGKPIIPAWSTTQQPPEPGDNQVVKWQNDTWVLEDILQPDPQAPEVVTPPVDQNIADLWQAMLAMSAELEALKGGR